MRIWPGRTSLVVFLAFTLVAVSTFGLARRVVAQEENRLLVERSIEAGAELRSSVTSIDAGLHSLGTLAPLPQASSAFLAAAAPLLTGLVRTVGLISRTDGGFSAKAVVGDSTSLSPSLSPERLALLRHAFAEPDMVTTVLHDGYRRRIGFALALPPDQGSLVVYQEDAIDPADPVLSPLSASLADLQVTLYASGTPSPSAQVVKAGDGSAIGSLYTLSLAAGAAQWTLVAQATRPLAGSFPAAVPWLLLAGGMVSALLAAAVLEVLARRRDYALTLVDQRTAELSESHEQLVQSERLAAVGVLAASVGHELRNPIAVISNSLYLIGQRLAKAGIADDGITRQVATANREVTAATLIVADLLDWSRDRRPIPTSVDLGALMNEVLESSPPPHGVDVIWKPPDPAPIALCDRDQTKQTLLNLLSNAYDALPASGGSVALEVAGRNGQVTMTVADDGSGMSAETRSQLFEPFFTTKSRGIGLGLAVTRRLVSANQGTLDVQSSLGTGTTVTVSLPRAHPSA
ncbi:MAG TPA: ATP-binding protein [Acidimicrobiales bacterium]|nr:ATP-binding protein [Acidimicrobiales bacterium]